ncbi:putative entry exclusion protein TrbK-alt [Sphingopyxis sp. MG]|uniref:putative entry exclusion protein TrbK-alt n=1 Tax=Sphingopyxis sp. MG TaxID=1866325 RepID=UPI000CDF370D|nr:putative entry exclusion protein TrbK-alt [Sphingopyxis sp. MG]AVA14685.1 hypothetical protein C3E99_13190 [Sphingopyxis sp. MG]
MGRAAKIAAVAVLGGLIMALAILHASLPPAPGGFAATMTQADAPVSDTAVAERCRTITVADPECEAAWDAKRRHFFGQKD